MKKMNLICVDDQQEVLNSVLQDLAPLQSWVNIEGCDSADEVLEFLTISHLRDVAVFSVFRRTAEIPLYRIEKRPKLRNRQGMYAVVGTGGQVLRRGHDLKAVLRVLDRKLIRAVD